MRYGCCLKFSSCLDINLDFAIQSTMQSSYWKISVSAYAKQLDGMLAKKITELTSLRGIYDLSFKQFLLLNL